MARRAFEVGCSVVIGMTQQIQRGSDTWRVGQVLYASIGLDINYATYTRAYTRFEICKFAATWAPHRLPLTTECAVSNLDTCSYWEAFY